MNIGLLVNTAPTMLQNTYRKLSLLECAKMALGSFMARRQKLQESKFDNYLLLSSSASKPLLSSFQHDMLHLQHQLNFLGHSPANNIVEALKTAIGEMNKFRSLSGSDGPLLGKEVEKLFPQVLLVVVDNLNPLVAQKLERTFLAQAAQYQKWDLQVHFIQVAIPPFRGEAQGQALKLSIALLSSLANAYSGEALIIERYEDIAPSMEGLADRLRGKVTLQLEPLRHSPSQRLFKDINQPQLKALDDSPLALSLFPNQQAVIVNHKIDQDLIFSPFSKVPFPSEPFSVQYAKDNRVSAPPSFFIDFNKICLSHPSLQVLSERYSVDHSSQLALKLKAIFQEHQEMKSMGFPLFVRNDKNEKVPFGVLRVEVAQEVQMALLLLPYDFPRFAESLAKGSLEEYSRHTPLYYQPFLARFLLSKGLKALVRPQNLFANPHNLNMAALSQEAHQLHHQLCNQYMEVFRQRELSQQQHEYRASGPSCCSSLGVALVPGDSLQEYLQLEQRVFNLTLAPPTRTTPLPQPTPLKDPYLEKEQDYRNEPEPFGNPFRLQRIKQERRLDAKSEMASDAYLTLMRPQKQVQASPVKVKRSQSMHQLLKENSRGQPSPQKKVKQAAVDYSQYQAPCGQEHLPSLQMAFAFDHSDLIRQVLSIQGSSEKTRRVKAIMSRLEALDIDHRIGDEFCQVLHSLEGWNE